MFNRIKRINSHVGVSRYLSGCKITSKRIPRVREIPSPYAFSPDHTLYIDDKGREVFIVETMHKRYDVFLSPYAAVGKWEAVKGSCFGS